MKILALLLLLGSVSAHAGTFTCVGTQLLRQGDGTAASSSDVWLSFDEGSENGLRMLSQITGHVHAVSFGGDVNSPDDAYMGTFSIAKAIENSKYRGRRYKNFSQFKDFDASATTGREDGMWGTLVLAKTANSMGNFEAAYIFQAGDHMGGTIPLSCTVKN